MTAPTAGSTWIAGGYNDLDSRLLERGKLIAVGIRDARGTETDMSPHNSDGSVGWTPAGTDGYPRADLFADRLVDGVWQANTDSNEGFHLIGAFHEGDGPSKNAAIDSDDYMIEQDNFPFDTSIVKEDEPFSFTGVETAKPLLKRLRNNLPLSDDAGVNLVELPGAAGAVFTKPIGLADPERQVLMIREMDRGGLKIYTATAYFRCKLTDIGASTMGKRDADAAELTFKPLPDGITMAMVDGTYTPILKADWIFGPGWAQMGGGATNGNGNGGGGSTP